jgi:uncharacterized SAM-binding protein YcdF (DUF218 family)
MSAPERPRPHRRAVRQLLLGLGTLLVVAAAVVAVLAVRLADADAPLSAASAVAPATVVGTGQAPDGRGVAVTVDDGGQTRRGVLVLADAAQARNVPRGARIVVQFDPRDPPGHTAVYANGDAAHRRVQSLLFGIVLVVFLAVAATLVTGFRLISRPRLRRAPAVPVTAGRVVVRQGLLVRSWLELVIDGGIRWLPVHWSPELAGLAPDGLIEVRGDPVRGRLVLPVIDGAELWPSGRLRARPPRGNRQVADAAPGTSHVGWGRQIRGDAVSLAAAPVLGLLWAYVDNSGPGGFVVATVVVAAALFWLAQLLGTDPAPPERD